MRQTIDRAELRLDRLAQRSGHGMAPFLSPVRRGQHDKTAGVAARPYDRESSTISFEVPPTRASRRQASSPAGRRRCAAARRPRRLPRWPPRPASTEPQRTSPTAKTPSTPVSSGSGTRSVEPTSAPVRMKPFSSRGMPQPLRQLAAGSAPVKRNRWREGVLFLGTGAPVAPPHAAADRVGRAEELHDLGVAEHRRCWERPRSDR